MRTIKFRAWDTRYKKMAYFHKPSFRYEYREMVLPVVTTGEPNYEAFGSLDRQLDEEIIIMQFTGLHDKKGKEIYEGDVVQRKDWHTDKNDRCVLSDANSYMRTTVIEYSTKEPFVGFCIPSKCEIIGNIYEHGHLLSN